MTSTADELHDVRRLRAEPHSSGNKAALRRALTSRSSFVVAEAAMIISESTLYELEADMAAALARFFERPAKNDPGGTAKVALAEALVSMESYQEELYRHGIRTVQKEPSFGPPIDVAAPLRATCARGLALLSAENVQLLLSHLLHDDEAAAREGAIQALYIVGPSAAPLLYYKGLQGDEDDGVLHSCLVALLKLACQEALSLATGYLDGDDLVAAEVAALALGESGLRDAEEPLRSIYASSAEESLRQTALVSLAMLRQETAYDFLLEILAKGSNFEARQALKALELARYDPALWQRVEKTREANERL